jgi:F0F1-type ATP synthase membrane subunit c/vacuolar-type H+-ATPase subunit K
VGALPGRHRPLAAIRTLVGSRRQKGRPNVENLLDDKINARLMTRRILFLAISSSNFMFAFVASQAAPHAPPEDQVLLLALAVVSVFVLVVSVVLPMTFEKRALASIGDTVDRPANDPNAPSAFAKHGTVRTFANPRAALAAALDKTVTPFILRMALREAVGIYGLVLVFVGYPLSYGLAFMGVSLLSQAVELPSLARTADALEAATGASLGPR